MTATGLADPGDLDPAVAAALWDLGKQIALDPAGFLEAAQQISRDI